MTSPARLIVKEAVVSREAVAPKKVAQSAEKITETLADKESSKAKVAHSEHKRSAAVVPTEKPSWAEVALSARKILETPADKESLKAKVIPAIIPTRRGSIRSLVQARGFGFIKTGKDTPDLFFHVRDCNFFEDAKVGEKVLFVISTDSQGNRTAVSVRRS